MLVNEKVVQINTETNKLYDQIKRYFNELNDFSERTEDTYRRDIEMFFKIIKDKELEYLTLEDVQLTLDDFEDYKNHLKSLTKEDGTRRYSNKSINRRRSSVKGLLKYLAAKKINNKSIIEDVSYLNLIKSLPEESNHHGVLETHEVFEMANLALHEREKGSIKRLLILFSLDTCVRKSALLNLKWSNFVIRESDVLVQGIDKGNKEFRHLISKDFYNELLTIKTDSEFVFDISVDSVDKMFKRLREKMGIQPERKIVFHSIRKAGVTYRYRLTGDVLEAQRAAGHSRLDTTRIYLEGEDYGVSGAVSSAGKLDLELFKKVDHEVLLEAISKTKKDFQILLNMQIMSIIDKK